mmetsp:Transcript_4661/g.8954  ORF Transcript_4661/g.8954 Transcript_4661/m.8954 type:complete len:237 (-) Transcript_4661:2606-3316(-)
MCAPTEAIGPGAMKPSRELFSNCNHTHRAFLKVPGIQNCEFSSECGQLQHLDQNIAVVLFFTALAGHEAGLTHSTVACPPNTSLVAQGINLDYINKRNSSTSVVGHEVSETGRLQQRCVLLLRGGRHSWSSSNVVHNHTGAGGVGGRVEHSAHVPGWVNDREFASCPVNLRHGGSSAPHAAHNATHNARSLSRVREEILVFLTGHSETASQNTGLYFYSYTAHWRHNIVRGFAIRR